MLCCHSVALHLSLKCKAVNLCMVMGSESSCPWLPRWLVVLEVCSLRWIPVRRRQESWVEDLSELTYGLCKMGFRSVGVPKFNVLSAECYSLPPGFSGMEGDLDLQFLLQGGDLLKVRSPSWKKTRYFKLQEDCRTMWHESKKTFKTNQTCEFFPSIPPICMWHTSAKLLHTSVCCCGEHVSHLFFTFYL